MPLVMSQGGTVMVFLLKIRLYRTSMYASKMSWPLSFE
jgi:hypothetical protein